jgi:hypothetical protein
LLRENEHLQGIPLHVKNMTHNEIWELIEQSDYFVQVPPDAELLLSIKMFGYPGNFVSTWLFIGYVYSDNHDVRSFRLTSNL